MKAQHTNNKNTHARIPVWSSGVRKTAGLSRPGIMLIEGRRWGVDEPDAVGDTFVLAPADGEGG